MMRWNSTKTYTEDDMLRMQQEAVSRVHEFQTRAQHSLPFYDVPDNAITPYTDPMTDPYAFSSSQPPSYDHHSPIQQSDNNNVTQSNDPHALVPTGATTPIDPIKGLLGKLNLDSETLLIFGLIFLLYNEKADNSLLMALAYLVL